MRGVVKFGFIMQVSSHALLCMTPVWLLMPKHDLKEYSHEMSKVYYFLNPSGNLRLLLSSCCRTRIDELLNAWLGGWVF